MIEADRSRSPRALLHLLNLGKQDSGDDLKDLHQRPVFILSTGRTGTQFLAHHFNRDPDVCALHEPVPSRGLRLWTVAYLEGAVDRSEMTSTLRQYRTGFFEKITEPIYVESNNFLAGFVEPLIEEFDIPTIIHVVRDPRTYVRSALNNGAAYGIKGLANRFIPFAHLAWEPKSEYPAIQRSARYWTLLNRHLQDIGQNYPAYHLFKYEELFNSGSEFERLVELVGAGFHVPRARWEDGRVNQSTRDLVPSWDRWSTGQQGVLIDTCGDLMVRLGYEI